jgi:hypothetical protein
MQSFHEAANLGARSRLGNGVGWSLAQNTAMVRRGIVGTAADHGMAAIPSRPEALK